MVDHTSAAGPKVTHVRGTLLVNSLRLLEESGHLPTYLELMPKAELDAVRYAVAASWIPISLALTHYQTCDRLGLSDSELERVGTAASTRIAETFLASALRAARPAGMDSVWFGIRYQGRLWDRLYLGGSAVIVKTGPKDLLGEMRGLPLVEARYFRIASMALNLGLARLLCKTAYIKPARTLTSDPHSLAFALSWV